MTCVACHLGLYEDAPLRHSCAPAAGVPLWESEMLTNVHKGIYTVWTHYSDGRIEAREVPKGRPVLMPLSLVYH